MAITHYRQLEVWRRSMDLAKDIYAVVRLMPKQEEYRLTAQMVRAAISVPANIAEGHTRFSRKDYANFVSIARGSLAELETLLLLAQEAGFLDAKVTTPLLDSAEQTGRMLSRLHARLREKPSP